jgi:hypothetical protein
LLHEGIKSRLPSLTTAWERLSVWLHTRAGEPDDYATQRDAICKHIEIIAALGDSAFVNGKPTLPASELG